MTTKFTKEYQIPDSISLVLASPDVVRTWSHGEITKPETINYRTGRSERGGLFDERIFGPEKDYECYCGKYKGIRYKDIVCEKCGVEVTRSIVRRDRMGHIELASPVAHIWFLRGIPSRMGLLLEVSITDLEKVIYFAGYIVTAIDEKEREKIVRDLNNEYKVKMKILEKEEDKERLKELFSSTKKEITDIKKFRVLSEIEYHNFSRKYGTMFEAGIGAEAIHDIFKSLDLPALEKSIEAILEKKDASATKDKLEKRLSLVRSLKNSKLRPEWMFLQNIPVIPPALRPMVGLEGGRYATSDVNDLYRRVINRNNRLKKLKEIGAPDVILRNEKRILQEAVDSLIDNSIRKHSGSQAVSQSQKRTLKSLSDNLKGKQGLFRQNLLGKRVDYSGRSVIVVGPNLKLNQCGLPKYMALELFRPFVISKIIARELAFNIRGAGKLIEDATPEVWEILDEVIEGKYVLLNRAPTLHRLSIQAFQPVLIEGKAIKLHPLVCPAFNADFDGDQMAVHVPLSTEAQIEARELIASNKNLLRPQSGDPIVNPSQDIVLGCYWMTKLVEGAKGEGSIYSSPNEAIMAYDFGAVDFRARVKVVGTDSKRYDAFNGQPFETSVGRLLFNSILPSDFPYMNEDQTKKKLSALIVKLINIYGVDATPVILDKIKDFGYKYVTISGTTLGYTDAQVPEGKKAIVAESKKKEEVILEQYQDGLISDDERYRKIIELWEGATSQVGKLVAENLSASESIHDMVTPGARGDSSSLNQVAGMKGVIVDAIGKPIDFPIISSFKEGLSPLEYFINTHSARKGLTDTALNTAKAGYLTRRLHDVGQDVVVSEEDCGTKEGIVVHEENIDGIIRPITRMLFGRVLATDAKTADGTVVAKKGTLVSRDLASEIEKAGVKEVMVRSPRTCATLHGLCQQCYGLDLGRNHLVKIGEAVGTIAAQAIGEPGTQLTLRTFHAGGVTGLDITTGLPRVEEIFEARIPKAEAVIATVDGLVADIRKDGDQKTIEVLADYEVMGSTGTKSRTVLYVIDPKRVTAVQKGSRVKKGDLLTDGSAVLNNLFTIAGVARAQEYIVSEINRVYELHSAPISEKHIEIIARQMFSRRRITVPGDTRFTTGDVVENIIFKQENERVEKEGTIEAKANMIVMGVAQVALTTESWLSSASFQNTNKVLISNAVRGGYDSLRGLKENIILGNLIPAGTGLSEDFVPAIKESQQE